MRSGAVGDDGKPVVDHWYGTTEPLSRVQADEELIFYDPVNFTELGRSAHIISNTFTPVAFQCTIDNCLLLRIGRLQDGCARPLRRSWFPPQATKIVAGQDKRMAS